MEDEMNILTKLALLGLAVFAKSFPMDKFLPANTWLHKDCRALVVERNATIESLLADVAKSSREKNELLDKLATQSFKEMQEKVAQLEQQLADVQEISANKAKAYADKLGAQNTRIILLEEQNRKLREQLKNLN